MRLALIFAGVLALFAAIRLWPWFRYVGGILSALILIGFAIYLPLGCILERRKRQRALWEANRKFREESECVPPS